MIRKTIVYTVAFGAIWCTAARAQDVSTAISPAATPQAGTASSATNTIAPASGDDVIHLHMPVHQQIPAHHRSKGGATKAETTAAPAETPTVDAIGADTTEPPSASSVTEAPAAPPPPAPPPSKPVKTSHKTVQQPSPSIPFNFGDEPEPATPPPPQRNSAQDASSKRETKTASLPPKPAVPRESPTPIRPPPMATPAKGDDHAGLTKRGAVMFDKGVSSPSPAQFKGVKLLASDVSTALEGGAGRVQLEAYGGAPGDKSSDARRLSLRRALAVRQLLIDNGVPSNRIDVRAMGGAEDKGPNDRVDVFVRAS